MSNNIKIGSCVHMSLFILTLPLYSNISYFVYNVNISSKLWLMLEDNDYLLLVDEILPLLGTRISKLILQII